MTGDGLAGVGALVTGGGGGLGSAAARWLARDGAAVTIMGRTEATLVRARDEIAQQLGPSHGVNIFVGDALERHDVEAGLACAADHAGGLGIAVATVGGGVIGPLLARDEVELLDEIRRNVVGTFLVIKHSVPHLVENGGGAIVCVSSDAATMSWPFMVGYATAKAAVDAMVRTAADELGHLKVRVNAVRPGLTRTNSPNSKALFSNRELIEEFVREKPLGRTGEPDDIAAGIRFLAGPESAWVTGQSLAIEGGNELRKAPSLEGMARKRLGDEVVDGALAGRIVER
jgi:NAD(P)-dependent dehydrogenase (short-subunit alcohol dehydrogenase family)